MILSAGLSSGRNLHRYFLRDLCVHALTFSQLDGRNSCRAPKGFAGSQGHLQGGPAPLTCLRLSAQLSFVSLLACLHGSRDAAPVRPSFFSAVALEGKEEKGVVANIMLSGCAIFCGCGKEVRNWLHPSSAQILGGAGVRAGRGETGLPIARL